MNTIGFVASRKENEKRRALLPDDLQGIAHRGSLYFEEGYGDIMGYCDDDFLAGGANIVGRREAFAQNILCMPKAPEKQEYQLLQPGQVIFGWLHLLQDRALTDILVRKGMTAIAWEDMFRENMHTFWRNNQLAGEAAVLHASVLTGKPFYECRVAVLGNGNVARGAIRILRGLEADIAVYDIDTIDGFRKEMALYDVVVNAVLWNVFNRHRIIYRRDLKKMKKGALIIDVSCNNGMEIETSRPSTLENPVYTVDGISHYTADHTPSLLWKAASESISREVSCYIDDLATGNPNSVLVRATAISSGRILDQNIIRFQNRTGG